MKRKKKEEETDWIMYPLSEDSRVAFDGIAQGKRFISIDGSNLREEEEKKTTFEKCVRFPIRHLRLLLLILSINKAKENVSASSLAV